ncbi:helix-turn-helix domain-containing protein [Streptomyces africanus]|uniref:helix-turn-helix domain-containing protein n=1 Tax=Streptomyces africanus TaxID=231024 RepID=UPI000A366907|nr:helix-turn-helix domain-containing protein [Streptomyces africanus]
MEEFLTVAQVADLAGVHPGSVYRWLDDPDVPLTKHKTPNGRVRIPRREAEEWARLRNTPVVVDVSAASPALTGITS